MARWNIGSAQPSLSIALIYDVVEDRDRTDVNAIVEAVATVRDSLLSLGHRVEPVQVSEGVPAFVRRMETLAPDVVFNLCEGYRGQSDGEAPLAGLLELLDLPYTGSRALALALALDKPLAKRLFTAADIPTPPFAVYSPSDSDVRPPRTFPAILKLAREDASFGLTAANVVADEDAFVRRLRDLFAAYNAPVMAEAFIDGREFTVPLVDGNPIAFEEIEFAVEPRIVCYTAKWHPGSRECLGTTPQFAPEIGARERARFLDLARRAYDAIGLSDYGRVDFRMDALGEPYVLEVNPNPDLTPGSGFRLALEHAGIPFDRFVARLIDNALKRGARR
jgi:D-alanine-D-alanine ligase